MNQKEQEPQKQIPRVWVEKIHANGRTYYFNTMVSLIDESDQLVKAERIG